MKLEHVSAVLRPRSDAEAADLGLAMVRRHALGIYPATLTLLLPLWALLVLLLPNYPSVVFFLVWWLKPIYDRVVLFYLGRVLFGPAPSWREQLREWPRLLTRRLGLSLFFGRLSGVRSFTMPVVVLEGLKGKAGKERSALLCRHGGGAAFGFVTIFSLLELAVWLGLWVGIRTWLPEEALDYFEYNQAGLSRGLEPPAALLWSLVGCYMAAVALMEPFYTGGGFGLYLNSRTHLEGWDVDLAFRQLGTRLRSLATPPAVMLAMMVFLGGICLPAAAADAVDPIAAKAEIEEVLRHPDFKEHVKKYSTWEPDSSTTPPPTKPEPEGWDWSWLDQIWNQLKGLFTGDWKEVLPRVLLALAVVAGLIWAARWIMRHRRPLGLAKRIQTPAPGPRTVMGMDVTPESLPADLPSAVWSAWTAGDRTAGVRLLYRGTLSHLMKQGGMAVRESDTEGDCLRHAALLPQTEYRHYFADLTAVWLATAYGQAPPESATMRQLCDRWPFRPALNAVVCSRTPHATLTSFIILLLAVPALTGCKGKWVEREEELGHLGEAKRNPWLAATRFLEANNIPVLQQRGITDLPDPTGVVIAPANALGSANLARHIEAWVRRGGHLIYLAEGGEIFRNDWAEGRSTTTFSDQPTEPFLASLNISLSPFARSASALAPVNIDGQSYQLSHTGAIRFDLSRCPHRIHFSAGPNRESSLASLKVGRGRVTLAASASPWRNRWIDNDDHAALLLALCQETDPVDRVTFIKAGRVSLWSMLLTHAWPALLALAVLILVWLWKVVPRFGPVRPLPGGKERRFTHHLDEAGTFLWKQKLTDALLEAPRQAVLAAARHQGIRQDERLFTQLLAARAGLPPERVAEAFDNASAADATHFTRRLADLQHLLHALESRRFPH